ncbi:MAG: sugar-binding domain-containing protein, partial [Acidobacteriota bacterium]
MKPVFTFVSCVLLFFAASATRAQELSLDARRVPFDADWRFLKGDAPGAEQSGFNDAGWRRLDLPHDWAIEGPFDPKYEPHNGALPFYGVGWYRKHFTLPASARGKYLSLEFDGAMANSRVWVNGIEVGGRPYGYIGFSVDLTPQLRFDGENVVAVRLAPEDESSRWYPGAGIYRHVWLDVTGPVHVDRWGTYVTTPDVTDRQATVKVEVSIRNRTEAAVAVVVSNGVSQIDPGPGGITGGVTPPVTIPAGSTSSVEMQIAIENPQRWYLDLPHLYRANTTLLTGGKEIDRGETIFCIRT